MAVTLFEVAKEAGVHKATAARALNRDPRISAATTARVQAAADKLGYRVNHLLAAWMSTRRRRVQVGSATIAYVTGHPTRYGWRPPRSDLPDFFAGAQAEAETAQYKLEDFWLHEPRMTPDRFTRILHARNIQGILIGRMPGTETRLMDYDWSGFSVVALGVTLRAPLFHRVLDNHFQATSLAAARCHALGYKRIGLVFDRTDDAGIILDMWTGGFLSEQLKWPKTSYRVPPLLNHASQVSDQRRPFLKWFREHRPDAILVSQVSRIRDWLASEKVCVPADVGLVELRRYATNATSAGLHFDFANTGRVGMQLLISLIHHQECGIPTLARDIVLPYRWVDGDTLGTPPDATASAAPILAP